MNPAEPSATSEFLTVKEVAARLRTTRWSVTSRCRNGELGAIKPFGVWLIPETAVDELIRSSKTAPETGEAS